MKHLSIIVPVYNVEPYLCKCLDSLLAQDLTCEEYEIIVVNDGSSDNSLQIAVSYANKYQNLRIISQENQGLGGARNTGILHASGKYMMFVDSDDYLEKNSIKMLVSTTEKNNLDILYFNYNKVYVNGNLLEQKNRKALKKYTGTVFNGEEFLTDIFFYACYVGVFIFNTAFIKEIGISFKSGIYFEDTEWLPKILLKVKRIMVLDSPFYFYTLRDDSITSSKDPGKKIKIINDKLFLIDSLNKTSAQVRSTKTRLWFKGMISLTVVSILSNTASYFPGMKNELISRLKNKQLLPLTHYRFTPKQLIYIYLINLSPELFFALKLFGNKLRLLIKRR